MPGAVFALADCNNFYASCEPVFDPSLAGRPVVVLSNPVAVIRAAGNGGRELASLTWGLVPSWSRDPASGLITARAETASAKPAFRQAFRRRRCLVPADGFFEWKKNGKKKQPFYFRLRDGRPFAFAGLWERWEGEGRAVETCALLPPRPTTRCGRRTPGCRSSCRPGITRRGWTRRSRSRNGCGRCCGPTRRRRWMRSR
jgi:putative SOS response-associated peptidase YedK